MQIIPESDLPLLKDASNHLAKGEGLVYVKCVLVKRGTDAKNLVDRSQGVVLLGSREEISQFLINQFGEVIKQYGEGVDNYEKF